MKIASIHEHRCRVLAATISDFGIWGEFPPSIAHSQGSQRFRNLILEIRGIFIAQQLIRIWVLAEVWHHSAI